MIKSVKIAIMGFGSIGRRHLLNVVGELMDRKVKYTIDLIRSGKGFEVEEIYQKHIQNVYYEMTDLPNDYDVIFITTPTERHYESIKKLAPRTKHMFIEKPVVHDVSVDIESLGLNIEGIYYVACPLRYTRVLQYLKAEVDLSTVYSLRAICSSYLPNWRPEVDYRTTYSAYSELGGGVSLDLIHEWDYIIHLFGMPEEVVNVRGQISELEIKNEDISIYIAKYNRMMVEVHLDYFGRKPIRELQLITSSDTIVVDLIEHDIRFLKSGQHKSFEETRNDFHRREITYFFDLVDGKTVNHNDIENAIRTLRVVEGRWNN